MGPPLEGNLMTLKEGRRCGALLFAVRATMVVLLASTNHPTGRANQDDAAGRLELACKNRLHFNTIAEFRQFVGELARLASTQAPDKKWGPHLARCLEQRHSIEQLERLIENYNKARPCKLSEVAKLEQFARRHLFHDKRALVAKFFALFGVNVGLNCKLNLLAHVQQADLEADQLDFIYSMASPTGWSVLINEYTKKSMKFGTSSHASSHVINRIAQLVPGLSQVDQLDYLNFHHVMNSNLPANWSGLERGSAELKGAELKTKLLESLEKIIDSCNSLDQFYVNSLLSLAKLRELGLLVEFLNENHERSVMLHKWLAATSFCQLMTRVRLLADEHNTYTSTIHFEIIHDDNLLENRRKLYSYAARFDEISDRAREMAWQASLNDGAWRQKSGAMWVSGNGGSSVAMRQLKQFIRGVEQGFFEKDEANNV